MNHFVLHHDGRFFYFIESSYGIDTVLADGEPMEKAAKDYPNWWIADHEAKRIEKVYAPTRKLLSYKLVADVPASEKYPATLSLDDYAERDEYDGKLSALYEGEYEEVPSKRELVEESFLRLEGAPPPEDGHRYYAKLPYELTHFPQYRHLFPGYLGGFADVLAKRLDEIPGVSAYNHHPFKVYAKIDYDRPVDYFDVGPRGGRKKKTQRTVTRELTGIHPPQRIEGKNRADAVAKWDASMEEYEAAVRRAVEVKLCSHCQGSGIVKPKAEA